MMGHRDHQNPSPAAVIKLIRALVFLNPLGLQNETNEKNEKNSSSCSQMTTMCKSAIAGNCNSNVVFSSQRFRVNPENIPQSMVQIQYNSMF